MAPSPSEFTTRRSGARLSEARHGLAELFERGDVGRAVREITALADRVNRHIAAHEPWKAVQDPERRGEAHEVCSLGINVFRALAVYLKPILPAMAERAESFLGVAPLSWEDAAEPLRGHSIEAFQPLFQRMDRKALNRVVEATRSEANEKEPPAGAADEKARDADTISIDEFLKVDLRVARIAAAAPVAGADKLLELTLDVGDHQRRVFSGIKSAYDAADLVGRHTVVVANLAPRKMRFGTSEGMVLAAGEGDKEIFLLAPDPGAKPGMIVR